MAERIDHAAEAREALGLASRFPPSQVSSLLAEALVDATLALVEQQRIANLIALVRLTGVRQESDYDECELLASEALHALIEYERTPATPFSDSEDVPGVRPGIREGLGL